MNNPEKTGAPPAEKDQEVAKRIQQMNHWVSFIQVEIEKGRMSPEILKNLVFPDKNPIVRPFKEGGSLFGYEGVVEAGSEIISMKGEKEADLFKGMEVKMRKDLFDMKAGEDVIIVGFREPFQNESSDNIILVAKDGRSTWVKSSELVIEK